MSERGKGPKFLKIGDEHVGHIWYSHSREAHFGALFAWGEKCTPLGPFRTAAQAKRATVKAATSGTTLDSQGAK